MNRVFLVCFFSSVLMSCTMMADPKSSEALATAYRAAIVDTHRPAEDVARDATRKPEEMLAFAGVAPGYKVVDFIPGGGYFTRLFSSVVGANGRVYAMQPPPPKPDTPDPLQSIVSDSSYANVSELPLAAGTPFAAPEPVDVIWTSQNYHDLHLTRLKLDVAAINKSFFAALKPGGVFIVLDHAALPGSGLDVPDKLHRIDPAIVKQEVTAAGFVFEGESTVLRSDADPHTAMVFDPSIRGKTDQFIYKFRKPK